MFKKHISWYCQLIVGILLFICSFFFEQRILSSFIDPNWLAILLAVSLELGKIMAIVWAARLHELSMKRIASFFRFGLLFLSMLCSLLYLAEKLDRPMLRETKDAEIAKYTKIHESAMEILVLDRDTKLKLLESNHKGVVGQIQSAGDAKVAHWESLMQSEMDNTVQGHFKGPRYREYDNLRVKEQENTQNHLQSESDRYQKELSSLHEQFKKDREEIDVKYAEDTSKVEQASFVGDIRVNNKHIDAFQQVVSVISLDLSAIHFVFWFSLFISLLMEVGIQIAFSVVAKTLPERDLEAPQVVEEEPPPQMVLDKEKETKRVYNCKIVNYACDCCQDWEISAVRHVKVVNREIEYICSGCGGIIRPQ